MAGNNLIVLPMDSINNKLIYADEDWHSIIINEEEVAKFKSRQENKKSKQFGIKEIYYLAVTRKLSKMKEAISKFKKVFKPEYLEEEIEEGRNDGRKIK